MARTDLDISDKTFTGEERLADLLALSRGTYTALQTVLRHVRSYNDLIEDDVGDHPAAADYLERSQYALTRALGWLEAFGHTVQGQVEAEKIDFRPLVEGVVQRCRRIASAEVEVELSFDSETTVVEIALFQLQDVLLEILQGFIDRMRGDAGSVHVTVQHTQLTQTGVSLLKSRCEPGPYVAVTVGLEAREFRPEEQKGFWDGLLNDWRSEANAELRLLRAYGVFLGHRGDVFFGREGDAPSLTVMLPIEGKRKDMQVEPNIEDDSLYGSETILLVDDEDMIWDVIIDMLQELGYSVVLAGNGLEAVEIYGENPGLIDLVMLDMVMPELDGHGAFFKLKEIDPDVRVLLSSGYVSEEDARDVLDAGAVGFLQKPYRMVDLARKVRSIFDGCP